MENKIYRGMVEFEDGRKFDDLYVNQEDALNYFRPCKGYKGIVRAELIEYVSDGFMYQPVRCLYEYDKAGNYYYGYSADNNIMEGIA